MKTKVFRISALLLAIMLVVSLAVPASAQFNSEVRDGTVAVVVGLTIVDTGRDVMLWRGSGFFVGEEGEDPTHLLTCYHVVELFKEYESGADFEVALDETGATSIVRAKIWVVYDSSDYEEAYLVASNKTSDVAVLKIAAPTEKRDAVTLQVPTENMVGKPIYAVGFPSLADNVYADPTSTLSATDCTVTSGVMSRLFVESGTGCEKVQIDCTIREGNSGGPLVNDEGNVVGICASRVGDRSSADENVYYAINISEAITLLKVNQVAYDITDGPKPTEPAAEAPTEAATEAPTEAVETQAETTEAAPVVTENNNDKEKEGGLSTGIILAIVGIIAVAVVAVVVVVATRKPKQAAAQPAQQVTYTAPTGGTGTSGFQTQAPAPARPVASSTAPAADPGTTILNQGDGETTLLTRKAEGGTLIRKRNNEKISINQETFTLGRKREDVTYCLTGNNAISRKHLEMTVRNGVTYVKSLSTSNPTYLNGMEMKTGEAKELHDGDKLTFADEEFVYSKQ